MITLSTNKFRAAVYERMAIEWKLDGNHIMLLRTALGIDNVDLTTSMPDEQNKLCELMLGEHGFTIFKMLLARNGVEYHD